LANQSQSGFICRGISGTFEAVVPIDLDSGGVDYFRRVTTDESDPSKAWVMHRKVDSGRKISAVSMILSNYGKMGELIEIIARMGKTLIFYSLNQSSWTWVGPKEIADGVTGNPALIQRSNGEFHLVVPLLGGKLAHYWRKNDNPDPSGMKWIGPETFGSGIISAVSMIESDYKNLELVAKEEDKLVIYQRTVDGWKGPYPMGSTATGPIDGVTRESRLDPESL
jgi:hypothetical protein